MAPLLPAALLLSWVPALAPVHDNSTSSSHVEVEGARVRLELQCQVRSVLEALALDTDRDGRLSGEEVEAGRDALTAYLRGRYVLRDGEGRALEPTLGALDLGQKGEGPFAEPWLRLEADYEAPRLLQELTIEVSLFREQNPFHRDFCTLSWNGAETVGWLFGIDGSHWRFEPAARRRPRVFVSHVGLGIEHILGGYDHIAFVLGLLVAARSLRGLVGTVTAFTLAHSVTLALAALGTVDVPSRLVELGIAMSVAYVGAEGLLFARPGRRFVEAFGFGLIHGLGFASFLGDSLYGESLKITALVGFNCGVEIGQLGVVLAAALALRWLPGDRSLPESAEPADAARPGRPEGWLAPRWARRAIGVAVTLFGSLWFCQRAGWLG